MLHLNWKGVVEMVAFGYIRKASWLDNPQNAAWLEAQRLAIRRFCRKKRIELQDFFEEEAERDFENSALEKLMEALERCEADCAVVCGDYDGARSYNIEHLERSAQIRFFSKNSSSSLLQELT